VLHEARKIFQVAPKLKKLLRRFANRASARDLDALPGFHSPPRQRMHLDAAIFHKASPQIPLQRYARASPTVNRGLSGERGSAFAISAEFDARIFADFQALHIPAHNGLSGKNAAQPDACQGSERH
jgi:hypothetical protein